MHGEGPMLVIAGPGSGKTFTIINRISHLITCRNVLPQSILVITFTKEAAGNLQRRFAEHMAGSYPVHFGTFHAIFYQIMKSAGAIKDSAILKDSEKKHMMIPLLKEYYEKRCKDTYKPREVLAEEALQLLNAIGYYKNTKDMDKASKLACADCREDFELLLEEYEKTRKRKGRIDFDDILYQCLELLKKDADILHMWQERFAYLLIDEMQDINPMQYEIVKLLAGKRRNVFAVGDDDQSIYGFRGARPELMQQFIKDFPGCKQVHLSLNYRSCREIVEASGKVISQNKKRFVKELRAQEYRTQEVRTQGQAKENTLQAVAIRPYIDRQSQYQAIADALRSAGTEALQHSAVLFRTHAQMQSFASVLRQEKIPYRMKEKVTCIYDHFVVQDINAYMACAAGSRDRGIFLKIMNKPSRYLSRDALEKEQVDFGDIKAYYVKHGYGKLLAQTLINIGSLEDDLKRMGKMSPFLAITYLRKKVGYEGYLREKAGTDREKLNGWLEILQLLEQEARTYEKYEDYLQYQEAFRQELAKKPERSAPKEGVHLMTVHASKGLEYDRVWIPDINEGTIPYGHFLDEEEREEERRIFYVAMTRAKKSLELSFVTGTKERPRLMSEFLNPLVKMIQ